EATVRTLEAGVDALILGRDLGEDAAVGVRAAIAARVPEERLAEAAGRVRRLSAWAASPRPTAVDLPAGREAARRALRAEGDVVLDGPAEIVELAFEPNIAAGRHTHSLTDVLPSTPRGQLVLVVRDTHRHARMRERVEAHPDAVVVETGLPYWCPPYARCEARPRREGPVVGGISRSGESTDVKAVVEEARRQGRPTFALANAPESPLARAAEAVLPLEAGEERSVAATKAYLNSLGAI